MGVRYGYVSWSGKKPGFFNPSTRLAVPGHEAFNKPGSITNVTVGGRDYIYEGKIHKIAQLLKSQIITQSAPDIVAERLNESNHWVKDFDVEQHPQQSIKLVFSTDFATPAAEILLNIYVYGLLLQGMMDLPGKVASLFASAVDPEILTTARDAAGLELAGLQGDDADNLCLLKIIRKIAAKGIKANSKGKTKAQLLICNTLQPKHEGLIVYDTQKNNVNAAEILIVLKYIAKTGSAPAAGSIKDEHVKRLKELLIISPHSEADTTCLDSIQASM